MSITGITQTTVGGVVNLVAASDLSGTVYFYWYLDGVFVGSSAGVGPGGAGRLALSVTSQGRIDVLDSADDPAVFDVAGHAPAVGHPPRRTLVWVRSLGATVARYRLDQLNGGSWVTIGYVNHDPAVWTYRFVTGRLADLGSYAWRVVPLDNAGGGTGGGGNAGTALTLGAQVVVRTPDAPDFTATFNPGATTVTLAEAA